MSIVEQKKEIKPWDKICDHVPTHSHTLVLKFLHSAVRQVSKQKRHAPCVGQRSEVMEQRWDLLQQGTNPQKFTCALQGLSCHFPYMRLLCDDVCLLRYMGSVCVVWPPAPRGQREQWPLNGGGTEPFLLELGGLRGHSLSHSVFVVAPFPLSSICVMLEPVFSPGSRVFAVDLSLQLSSGWRPEYTLRAAVTTTQPLCLTLYPWIKPLEM